MGGFFRVRPGIIPAKQQRDVTCSVLGCPDPAIVTLPLNETVLERFAMMRPETIRRSGQWWMADYAPGPAVYGMLELEVRLCRKCIRTLATALPPGKRIAGAVLRYPEIHPDVAAAEEIPGTPEFDEKRKLVAALGASTGDQLERLMLSIKRKLASAIQAARNDDRVDSSLAGIERSIDEWEEVALPARKIEGTH